MVSDNDGSTCYTEYPLHPGDAVAYWQLSDITEQRYDVADRAMQGEMDPFFFLSKHNNFIPHTYPCRTEFIEQHAGRHPTPLDQCRLKKWWFPFGSDRVDLSGFWFRATRVGAWANTMLRADAGGEATFRLTTCGGAMLLVNGQEIAWSAQYQRNLKTALR